MLKNLQDKYKDAVLFGKNEPFLSEIQDGGKITPEQRLEIYSHAYRSRLVEVLAEDFPVLHSMVGDDMFEEICLGYIDEHPSEHPSLRYFGQYMSAYLEKTLPYRDITPAIEMAIFEWSFNDVFDAHDEDAVTVEQVAAISPEAWTTLRIKLQSSYRMHLFKWNTPAVWSTVTEGVEKPMTPQEYPTQSHCIQWKKNLGCFFRTVADDEAKVLRLVQEEKSFPEICELLLVDYGEHASHRAAELFRGWVMEGLVSDLEYAQF